MAKPDPLLIVISGPSGVGKDAILSRMKDSAPDCHFTITATTRPRRPNEKDGIDYIFLTRETFQSMIASDELLEWAEVYGNYYGVPKSQVKDALNGGQNVVVKIDVQGAATVRRIAPESLMIFISPPDMRELENRLKERMTEADDDLKLRLETARVEMNESSKFDYVVVNNTDQLDDAVAEIQRIIAKEQNRVPPRRVCF